MVLDGRNKDISRQIKIFKKILLMNNNLKYLLQLLDDLDIDNCYIGAGCINQTIFNYYHGYELDYGINDYDIVYYDCDTSYEAEDRVIKLINSYVKDKSIKLDIKNQARVHIWFYEKYGIKRKPYVSVEDAIGRWTSTVTCIGVKMCKRRLYVYVPYGLNDLFNMIIRPVKIDISKDMYDERCIRWKKKWPMLKIISWEGDSDESINNGC